MSNLATRIGQEFKTVRGEVVDKTANQAIDGVKTFTSFPVTPSSAPTSDYQVANKKYVDNAVGQLSTDYYQGAYGLKWDNVNDTYTRLGAGGWSSIQSEMKRCVLNSDGTVNYYLDPTDSTKKLDGTPANLDGTDGNVMVEIPKTYVKYDNTNGAKEMWISKTQDAGFTLAKAFVVDGVEVDYRYFRAYECSNQSGVLKSISGVTPTRGQTIGTFRSQAEANGTGWHLTDWHLLHLVQTLLFIEIGNFNSQSVLGNGNDTGGDYGMTTGQSNSIGNGISSAGTNDNTWMSYRGIENFYGDIWEFIDGINISDRSVYLSDNPSTFASDVFSGDYVYTGLNVPTASADYIKDMNFSVDGFIPTTVGGSSSTYVTDGLWTNIGSRIAAFGGNASVGLLDGSACLNLSIDSAYSDSTLGGSVSK